MDRLNPLTTRAHALARLDPGEEPSALTLLVAVVERLVELVPWDADPDSVAEAYVSLSDAAESESVSRGESYALLDAGGKLWAREQRSRMGE